MSTKIYTDEKEKKKGKKQMLFFYLLIPALIWSYGQVNKILLMWLKSIHLICTIFIPNIGTLTHICPKILKSPFDCLTQCRH